MMSMEELQVFLNSSGSLKSNGYSRTETGPPCGAGDVMHDVRYLYQILAADANCCHARVGIALRSPLHLRTTSRTLLDLVVGDCPRREVNV